MVKVVVCNGFPGSGKTTFQEICRELCHHNIEGYDSEHQLAVKSYSTVTFVKEIAFECGWSGKKTPENRKFLSDLKDLLTQWNDVPFKKTVAQADFLARHDGVNWILFVDCREPTEIQRLKERLNATTVLIRRESVENSETSNHADANVFDYNYDVTIYNNGSLDIFKTIAEQFIKFMKQERVPHYEYK